MSVHAFKPRTSGQADSSPVHDIKAVLAATDLAALISEDIELRRSGKGLEACCPFHDEKTPSFTVAPEKGFYHCLAGETEVVTWDGIRRIDELSGGTHRILTRGGDWVDAPFKSYGEQRLFRICLGRNGVEKVIYATDGHRWFIRGSNKARKTTELKPKDRLSAVLPAPVDFSVESEGVRHGIVFGDGFLDKKRGYCVVALHDGKAELGRFFSDYPSGNYLRGEDHSYTQVRNLPPHMKSLPSLDSSADYLAGFVAGYLATDGHISKDATIMLNCKDKDTLQWVRDACLRIGIGTFGVTSQERNGYLSHPTSIYRIHFITSMMRREMVLRGDALRRFDSCSKKYERIRWAVKSVEQTDRIETVYCAEVPETHSFVLNDNILTGNCFGCGAHGDALDWMVEYRSLPFRAALESLAGAAGMGLDPIDNGASRARKARAVTVEIEGALSHELHVLLSAVGARVTYRAIPKQTLAKHPHIAKVPDAPWEREYEAAQRIAKALYALYGARA